MSLVIFSLKIFTGIYYETINRAVSLLALASSFDDSKQADAPLYICTAKIDRVTFEAATNKYRNLGHRRDRK